MYKNEAFQLGEQFHKVACELVEANFLEENDDGYWFVPSVVNLAFACELYMKSLISNGESGVHGHCFVELYKKLSEHQKDEIRNSQYFIGDKKFEEKLTSNNKLFKEWRYVFEHQESISVDVGFLENFAMALHNLAEKEVASCPTLTS